MRLVVQRVSRAAVRVAGRAVAEIGPGLLVLVGVGRNSAEEDVVWLANKVATLRIFEDDEQKMNLSVQDVRGAVLVVPQFTLLGDARKGRRPSWAAAAVPEVAAAMVERFAAELGSLGLPVQTGGFREHMEVELVNDGPVTMVLEGRQGMELRRRFRWE